MSDTPETDRTERRWRDYALLNVDDIFDFARRLERERDAERALADRLAGALMVTRWDSYTICKEALAAWKEARFE